MEPHHPKTSITPGPHHFIEYPLYTDPGAINQQCRDLLPPWQAEAKALQIGVCELHGPGQVAEDRHETWSQYFIVSEGGGRLYLDGNSYRMEKDMIVEIPKGTSHYARCEEGEHLRYFFINLHDSR